MAFQKVSSEGASLLIPEQTAQKPRRGGLSAPQAYNNLEWLILAIAYWPVASCTL